MEVKVERAKKSEI